MKSPPRHVLGQIPVVASSPPMSLQRDELLHFYILHKFAYFIHRVRRVENISLIHCAKIFARLSICFVMNELRDSINSPVIFNN